MREEIAGRQRGVADYLKPTGFWSYTTSDDTASGRRLSQLRLLLAQALQLRVGRNPQVRIFQDVTAIPHGTDWLRQIEQALGESSFLIPILTPAFLQSEMCCREVMHFRAREAALGRDDLIFPLHYIDVEDIDPHDPGECHDARVLTLLRSRQAIDFRTLRLRDAASEAVSISVDAFAASIRQALRRQANGSAAASSAPAPPPPVQPATAPRPPAASPQPGAVTRDGPDYPELVLVPAGDYLRGVPDAEEEREGLPKELRGQSGPLGRVTIPAPFWLGRYPVTRGEFAAFVADTNRTMPNEAWTFEPNKKGEWQAERRTGRGWRNPGYEQTDRHPVVCVSHEDAMAYAAWLSRKTGHAYRLPSEAEWEYAARAGTRTARFWGDDRDQACRYANVADRSLAGRMNAAFDGDQFFDCDDGFAFTAPVGSFLPNLFGLYDMLGNVLEWTADMWHDNYKGAPDYGTAWNDGGDATRRVLRGGSWGNDPWRVRAGVRKDADTDGRSSNVGFRVARTSV